MTIICKLDIAKMAYIGVFSNFVSQNIYEIFTPHIKKTIYARIRLRETFPPKLFLKWLGKPCWYAKQKTLFYATGPDFVDFSHMQAFKCQSRTYLSISFHKYQGQGKVVWTLKSFCGCK